MTALVPVPAAATPVAPSPFLPGTNVQWCWDSTSLNWLKTCPRLYQYSMLEGWRLKMQSVHLQFGILYHSALELYDRQRANDFSHDDALAAAVEYLLIETWDRAKGEAWDSGHTNKTRETLVRSVIWYCEQFHNDPASTVILDNGKPAVELSFKLELEFGPKAGVGSPGVIEYTPTGEFEVSNGKRANIIRHEVFSQPYVLSGHLDRVVEYAGDTYVMDRKTSSSTISSTYFKQFEPSNQMSLYTFASQVIYKTPVKGVIIDAVQIAVGFSRFTRGVTYRTSAQLEEWLADTKHWLKMAEGFAEANYWPMNDTSCTKYGECAFHRVCSKSPEVRDRFLESDYERRPWNPLSER